MTLTNEGGAAVLGYPKLTHDEPTTLPEKAALLEARAKRAHVRSERLHYAAQEARHAANEANKAEFVRALQAAAKAAGYKIDERSIAVFDSCGRHLEIRIS